MRVPKYKVGDEVMHSWFDEDDDGEGHKHEQKGVVTQVTPPKNTSEFPMYTIFFPDDNDFTVDYEFNLELLCRKIDVW